MAGVSSGWLQPGDRQKSRVQPKVDRKKMLLSGDKQSLIIADLGIFFVMMQKSKVSYELIWNGTVASSIVQFLNWTE